MHPVNFKKYLQAPIFNLMRNGTISKVSNRPYQLIQQNSQGP